ncbi:carboxyl transferase domain-containing protein [Stenotrophomonas sp. NPDC087984]
MRPGEEALYRWRVTGWGAVDGRTVYVYAHDLRTFGGALGQSQAAKTLTSDMLDCAAAIPVPRPVNHVRVHTARADERSREGLGDSGAAPSSRRAAAHGRPSAVDLARPGTLSGPATPLPPSTAPPAPPDRLSGHFPALAPRPAPPPPREGFPSQAPRPATYVRSIRAELGALADPVGVCQLIGVRERQEAARAAELVVLVADRATDFVRGRSAPGIRPWRGLPSSPPCRPASC